MSDLYQLGRRLTDIAIQGMGAPELDISPSEFMVLRDLVMNGRSSITDTIGRTGLAQSRVSTSVKALASRGWVITLSDPNDGRRTLAEVTPEVAAEALRRRNRDAADTLDVVLADCPPEERAALADALRKLHQLLVAHDTQPAASTRRRPNRSAPWP
jgi:MarR family 2-MHQ and catechol resistance regulon transcriptional repressor